MCDFLGFTIHQRIIMMNIKLIPLIACTLLFSASASAGVISYAGYDHDEASNVVVGGGLEWLRWDLTKGQSINQALTNYSQDGWRVASNVEMADLFNTFNFGGTFDSDESTVQGFSTMWTIDHENDPHEYFIQMFGRTSDAPPTINMTGAQYFDPYETAMAFYGLDLNGNGEYNEARVAGDFVSSGGGWEQATAWLEAENISLNQTTPYHGIALVRSSNQTVSADEPSFIMLLSIFVFGLCLARNKKRA